ncbi:MAG: acyl-CoA dehydrogenase [Planctomycetes bacterium]|nr:acyl-CoA dehydrogenase [Planctomycetota bacterium]
MHIAVTIAVVFGSAWLLAGLTAPYWTWVAAACGALAYATATQGGPDTLLIVLWCTCGLAAALLIPPIRRTLVASPALTMIRNLLPPVSDTEREALEAGTVWFDADLFSGAPRWDRFLAEPAPALSAEEEAFLGGATAELCPMLDDWGITHDLRDLPPDVWEFIKTRGFLGMIIPKEHGGLGFSAQGHSAVVQKISTRSCTAAISVMVPNSLGPAELLLHYGTDAQRARYLPRLASGDEIPSFALTSPSAGSDAAAMPDRGVVCRGAWNGQDDVLGMRVTWDKRYITLAPVTTLIGLAFRAFDPDGLLGGDEDLGITLALVPADLPGVDVGRRHDVSKQAMLNGPTRGADVFIAMEQVIGGEERIGQGWRMLMDCLSAGRSVSLPATSAAAAKFCARNTGAYARIRTQFKTPIGKFEGVEEKLANIAGQTYALEAARCITAAAVDAGEKPSVISALLKYESTERMRSVVNDAMDVHGGRAICEGPSNYLSNAYQFIPISITVEGANILTRTLIVFGQGAIRCHPWLLKEMEAAAETDRRTAVRAMDRALGGHIRHLLANLSRAAFHNLTGGWFASAPKTASGEMRHWYRQLTRASASFAIAADFAFLSLGGMLKRKEKLSGRFADVLAELYMSSCVLKRFEDDGRPDADRAFVHWNLQRSLWRIQGALQGILQNLPARPLAWVLRLALFPLGRRRLPPADDLGHKVARVMLEPGEARDRLCRGAYVCMDKDDVTGRLEHALRATIDAAPYERRLRDNAALSDAEMSIVLAAREAVAYAIAVDEFDEDEFGGVPWRQQRHREGTTA